MIGKTNGTSPSGGLFEGFAKVANSVSFTRVESTSRDIPYGNTSNVEYSEIIGVKDRKYTAVYPRCNNGKIIFGKNPVKLTFTPDGSTTDAYKDFTFTTEVQLEVTHINGSVETITPSKIYIVYFKNTIPISTFVEGENNIEDNGLYGVIDNSSKTLTFDGYFGSITNLSSTSIVVYDYEL